MEPKRSLHITCIFLIISSIVLIRLLAHYSRSIILLLIHRLFFGVHRFFWPQWWNQFFIIVSSRIWTKYRS